MPRATVQRWVGRIRHAGILIATLAGTIAPAVRSRSSHRRGLRRHHADVGAAIAFITSWTLLGYPASWCGATFFGGEFVFWRTVV
jgi:uncharacterized membrane protein YraQ (UPF0718 family)